MGSRIASGSSDCTVRVWGVESRSELACLEGHDAPVNAVAITADGAAVVSGSSDCTMRWWNVARPGASVLLGTHAEPVNAVALSPDGGCLASASDDRTLRLWQVATRREMEVVEGDAIMTSCAFLGAADRGRP